MTNIQILFFCGLSVVFIGVMFLMLWKVHKVRVEMDNLQKEHAEEMKKMKELCNKIYEKLKEVVDKVNPLLAGTENQGRKKNDPGGGTQCHPDLRISGLCLHPPFLPHVQALYRPFPHRLQILRQCVREGENNMKNNMRNNMREEAFESKAPSRTHPKTCSG